MACKLSANYPRNRGKMQKGTWIVWRGRRCQVHRKIGEGLIVLMAGGNYATAMIKNCRLAAAHEIPSGDGGGTDEITAKLDALMKG